MLRKERERERAVIFSVLVCLPAGMWALSLRPPPPRRRRERTNACAIRGPEHGEHRNRRTCYQRNGGCRAGPIIIRLETNARRFRSQTRRALNFSRMGPNKSCSEVDFHGCWEWDRSCHGWKRVIRRICRMFDDVWESLKMFEKIVGLDRCS